MKWNKITEEASIQENRFSFTIASLFTLARPSGRQRQALAYLEADQSHTDCTWNRDPDDIYGDDLRIAILRISSFLLETIPQAWESRVL